MPIFPTLPERVKGQGLANAALTVSTPEPVSSDRRTILKAVFVTYSAVVTANVTVTLNSGAGAAFDVRLATITLTAERWGWFIPPVPIPLSVGDTIDVAVPAGGTSITATAQLVLDHEYPLQDGEGGFQADFSRGG